MKRTLIPSLKWHHPRNVDADGFMLPTYKRTVLYSNNGNWGITRERDANYRRTGRWLLFWTGCISGRKLRGIRLTGFFTRDVATGLTLGEAKRFAARLDHHNVYTPKKRGTPV